MDCFLCNKPVEHTEESAFLGRYAHQACFLESLLKQRDAALEIQKLEKERINVEERRDEDNSAR